MKPVECPFEADALAACLQSTWPARAETNLRTHVAGCPICSDIVIIAGALDHAREEMREQVAVPDSGRVWWLAQIRARREAAEAAGRPITAAQLIAFASAVGLLGACFGATSTWFQSTLGWMKSSVAAIHGKALVPSAIALLVEHGALALGTALLICVVPTAVFWALRKD
jgi:hypothetical protein